MILSRLNKFENFQWLGLLEYPNKVREFLSEIDIYALITGIDMSPLTLLEAQLMKKPIIATNVGGVPELMQDEITGFLIEKGNSKQLEEKIDLIFSDESISKKMGVEGRRFVEVNFQWDTITKKFLQSIKEKLES